jgi:ABC-type multidrug transport system ATPase subunit
MPLNTTIIVITHRAASLTWMDRILVMDDGKITEDSPPLALLQKANNKKHYEGMATESYYRAAGRIEGNKALQQAIQSAKASAKARLCEKSRRIEDTRKEDQTNPSCEKIPVDEQRAGSSL